MPNERKKRLLYFVESMGGGVLTYLVGLSNNLVDYYDIYLAYGMRSQTPAELRDYFDSRIHLIPVESFVREINWRKDLKAINEVKAIARNIQPDIIHLHSSKAGGVGRIAFGGKKVPVFYTPHGYSFLMKDCTPIKRMAYKLIEKMLATRHCTTISCSEGEHRETLRLTKRALYVNNAVNTDELQAILNQTEHIEHPFTVFTLGRICTQKGPDIFNCVAASMPDVKFLWIGDGELRDQLTSPNIEISGWVQRDAALRYALNTDAFILTSLWEGLPISLLEAMYMEKPCIVSNVIGNRDVIHNGLNGYVCESTEDYIRAIRDIQSGKNSQYSAMAHKDIIEKYTTSTQAKQYIQIYEGKC